MIAPPPRLCGPRLSALGGSQISMLGDARSSVQTPCRHAATRGVDVRRPIHRDEFSLGQREIGRYASGRVRAQPRQLASTDHSDESTDSTMYLASPRYPHRPRLPGKSLAPLVIAVTQGWAKDRPFHPRRTESPLFNSQSQQEAYRDTANSG